MSASPGVESAIRDIQAVLDEEVRPGLLPEGDVEVVALDEDDVLQIRFVGVCPSCPATAMGLIMGIESAIRARVPRVKYVEAVP